MRSILYLSQQADIQAQLVSVFWQAMSGQGLPQEPACFYDEPELLAKLATCRGEWLLVILGRPHALGELQRLENQCSRLLTKYQPLTLKMAVYDWQTGITASEQAHNLAQLADDRQHHRQCLAVDVEFDAEWSALPPYRYRLLLCNGARCARRGSGRLWKQLAELLAQQGLLETPQGALLVKTHCQFPCNHGPIVSVYPGEYWYGIRQLTDIQKLVEQHIKHGRPIPELLLDLPLLSTEA